MSVYASVHPRVCGEQSSRAEKCRTAMLDTVHPRVCGEQDLISRIAYVNAGSSPRLRGTETLHAATGANGRFIPASAGNSACIGRRAPQRAVHPRVCGEQESATANADRCAGSSPRLRGTVFTCRWPGRQRRFIPASAGNRRHGRRSAPGSAVHPRVCGEQWSCSSLPLPVGGSSPRLRGTGGIVVGPEMHRRFIPASAGNSFLMRQWAWLRTVHPRVCGEQAKLLHRDSPYYGSSPRLRGTGSRAGHRS